MTRRELAPPSGFAPPIEAPLAGRPPLDLLSLAREISRRYQSEFPDELQRYGDAGKAWCVHDNQHLLNWAALHVRGDLDMERQVAWLADVLAVRGYPLDRLLRDLEIAAEVVTEEVEGQPGVEVAEVLLDASRFVGSRVTRSTGAPEGR